MGTGADSTSDASTRGNGAEAVLAGVSPQAQTAGQRDGRYGGFLSTSAYGR